MSESAGKPVPKPAPPPRKSPVKRWFQAEVSEYPWEQAGLDHVRAQLPDVEPFRAWATFSFTANSGRINECDLFVAVPAGLYLLELKGHPGHVVNSGETWSFRDPDSGRVRTLRNPLHLTDRKTKELKSRLEQAARADGYGSRDRRFPWIQPAVFLSAPNLTSELDHVQAAHVYGRDGLDTGLPAIWADLLGRPPQHDSHRITAEFARLLPKWLEKIGVRASTAHLDFADDWRMRDDVLDEGPTWQDRLARRTSGPVKEQGRVRLYLTERQATPQRQQTVERAARREYEVLQGITHRGIAQAVQIRDHQSGPAILFRHRAEDLRLDDYLAARAADLTPQIRLDLVRQVAEAVRYAHDRALYHRALAARSIYVSPGAAPEAAEIRIIDWQAAARDFETTGHTSLNEPLTNAHIEASAQVYLAPEFQEFADPVALDVFGVGAVAYLILTGQPPAALRTELTERVARDGGLHPSVIADGIVDSLDHLVFEATRSDWNERLPSVEEFLHGLDEIEKELTEPLRSAHVIDPLTATPGQLIDGDWMVDRVLGTGATARALLVTQQGVDDDGADSVERKVLKIALDATRNARLTAEARALEQVGGGIVVKLLGPLRELGERMLLDLEFVGEQSLGMQLRAEGRLSYHDLERFGGDLFTALDQLAGKGIRHRDIKPDNLGVLRRADRSRQLKLFDFSLAGVSDKDIKAGTHRYLDPFLGDRRRPVFDDHAEWYAVAVTLYQMAAGELPRWGDDIADPKTIDDETPKIVDELFEPALREGLSSFFHRALHRDVNRRFDTLKQMEEAWRGVFRVADATAPASSPETDHGSDESLEEQRDTAAQAVTPGTLLVAAGLSPRAQSVAATLNAYTVGELLDVPPYEIPRVRGAGASVRRELNRRHKQWTTMLGGGRGRQEVPSSTAAMSVDDMAAQLLPEAKRRSKKTDAVRLTLGLPAESEGEIPPTWPTQAEVANRLGVTQATVSTHHRAAAKEWAGTDWLVGVRDELVGVLESRGRVCTVDELAVAIRVRHGASDAARELVMARALAVVRAAVEAETAAEVKANADEVSDPRLAVLRRAGRVLVALESLHGTDVPSAQEMADYAVALGKRADQLVADQDSLPGAVAVVRELRAVAPPEGLPALADTRLVGLAARMSKNAAGSPRLELYPRELDLARALRLSQAAAGVRRDPGISPHDLIAKVRARFPDLNVPSRLTHVVLGDALRAAGFELEYDTVLRVFRAPAPEVPRSSSSQFSNTSLSIMSTELGDASYRKLALAVERGGFRALTLHGRHLPGLAATLAQVYEVSPVDFNTLFLTEFRALAAEQGTDWEKVLTIDARFTETGRLSQGLRSYVDHTWQRVESALLARAAERQVLLVHDAGLLARYFEAGGRELLVRLQKAARRAPDRPHGLWLLCPGEAANTTPRLDGRIVEIEDTAEQVVLGRGFMDQLKSATSAA
ncbi:BREX system serine/threonine kinase PglW [Actinokineospora sp. NBRC 105648]|uniref:BREX system serine/threonine kinase PglW n=1 Tax=Actinokineospora sp. NBRC 105648 TaxID=3032206 RepID=UPI002557391C|nr:BREX system serine/threonine kinase PglW [Actinokineospora sp. NBRC 105648]